MKAGFPFAVCGLVSLSFGCESAQFADEYRVGIDPAFTANYQTMVTEVVEDWQSKLGPQIHLSITYASCSRSDGDRLICFHPADDALFAIEDNNQGHIGVTLGTQDSSASSDIYLKLSALTNPTLRRQCTLHEMGHGLGLIHTTLLSPVPTGKHIMDPGPSIASEDITCEDIQQFWSLRTLAPAHVCQDVNQPEDAKVPVVGLVNGNWD